MIDSLEKNKITTFWGSEGNFVYGYLKDSTYSSEHFILLMSLRYVDSYTLANISVGVYEYIIIKINIRAVISSAAPIAS